MSDDFGALFDVVLPPEESRELGTAVEALGRFDLTTIPGSSLTTLSELVALRERLYAVERMARDRREAIDRAFVRAAAEAGADQLRTADGVVRFTLPAAQYETDAQAMRRDLERLVPRELSAAELDDACPIVVSYGVNHTRLNYLAKHRGDAVSEAIEANRRRVEPDRLRAKVAY